MSVLIRFYPLGVLESKYVSSGRAFGLALSSGGPDDMIEQMRGKFAEWEQEYARRGYRTVSPSDFANLAVNGAYGFSIDDKLRQLRGAGEEAVFHSTDPPKVASRTELWSEWALMNARNK